MRRAAVVVCALIAACGGDDGKKQDSDKTLTLSIDAATLSLVPGASQSTILHLTRGATLAGTSVALTASGVPSGVSLSFDSASTTADSVGVTISVTAAAALGDTTITINGADGDVSATASMGLSIVAPTPITVHGMILSPQGYVTAPTEIHVYNAGEDTPQVVTSNADGTFTVGGVVPPYDIVVPFEYTRHLFLGLTRTDPTIACYYDNYRSPTTAVAINVTFTSTGTITAETQHDVVIECAHARAWSFGSTNPLQIGHFTGYLPGPETCTAKAIEYKAKADGLPTAFGSGQVSVNVVPTNDAVNVTLPITSYTGQGTAVSLTAIDSTGSAAKSVLVDWDVSDFYSDSVAAASTVTVPLDAAAPAAAAGLNMLVFATAESSNWHVECSKRLTSDASQSIQCPAPPSIVSPLPSATGVDDHTVISVAPIANATYLYQITLSPDSWYITTTATSFTVSDFARFGLALPTDGRYIQIWEYVFDNVPTMDAWGAGASVDPYRRNLDGGGTRYVFIGATVAGP